MNGIPELLSKLIYLPGTKTPGHSLQQFVTHDHFGKLDIFFRKVTHNDK